MPNGRLSTLLAFVRSGDRICPEPGAWMALHRLLGHGAPRPLILGAWYALDWAKRRQLEAQIRFAAEHGKLAQVDRFLRRCEWYVDREPDPEPLIYRLLDRPRAAPVHRRRLAQLAFTFR